MSERYSLESLVNPSSAGNIAGLQRFPRAKKSLLRGISVAMYIVGQERRLVDPPSQVVAGVRTVTTNMDGRDALPRMSRPFAFSGMTHPLPQVVLTQSQSSLFWSC